jgi:Na+-transporting NADH:ubiquinone oxidoreductase subunit B
VWAKVDYQAAVDGVSGATPLLAVANAERGADAAAILGAVQQNFAHMDYSWWNCFLGFIPGSIGETSTLACLIGAAILIATGIGSWRTMAAVVIGCVAMTIVMNSFASAERVPMLSMPIHWHLVVGGFAFGAVYMATDPVSSATTDTGKWIYGVLIGMLAVLIRTVNPAYPEGMMLAILFMNLFAPTIDYFVVQANIRRRRLAHAAR